jgi:hypothetical protein
MDLLDRLRELETEAQTANANEIRIGADDLDEIITQLEVVTRPLDGKFQIKGGQIVKMSNGEPIPIDEPVFLFRARDRLAVPMLRIYEQVSVVDGCNDYHFDALNQSIQRFEKFAKDNPNRMKQPSVTRGK